MRLFLITAAGLLTLSLAATAFAAPSEDAAYDINQSPIIDSN